MNRSVNWIADSWLVLIPGLAVQTAQFVLSGATGALAVVAVAVIRIYLGWAYVGNRLLSAAVDYEETGW